MRKSILAVILFAVLSLNSESVFAKDFCPENVQAAILLKVLGYTNKIGGVEKNNITIGILNGGQMVEQIKSAAENSNNKKIAVKEVTSSNLQGIDIVYIPQGAVDAEIKKVIDEAKKKKIFTVAGDPEFMNKYSITFNVYLEEQKPKLMVDLESSDKEGVTFSAELLKISQRKQ